MAPFVPGGSQGRKMLINIHKHPEVKKPSLVARILAPRRKGQVDLCKYKASLVHITSSILVWTTLCQDNTTKNELNETRFFFLGKMECQCPTSSSRSTAGQLTGSRSLLSHEGKICPESQPLYDQTYSANSTSRSHANCLYLVADQA